LNQVRPSQTPKVTLQLPNGSVLKSRYTHERGGKFWRTYTYVDPSAQKLQMPLVSGVSSGTNQHVIALDFDYIAPKYASYSEMADDLYEVPGAIVSVSPSGRLKAFVVINWYNNYPDMDKVAAKINEILPDGLKGKFDAKGMKTFYLSAAIAESLSSLDASLVWNWDTLSDIVSDRNNVIESKHSGRFSYHSFDGQLPAAYELFVNRGRKGAADRECFIRILIACQGLATSKGWSLSQLDMALYLGVSPSVVHGWIKACIDAGLLKTVSHSYIVGLRAKTYAATGALLESIRSYKASLSHVARLPKALPKDGEFYSYLLSLSRTLSSWDDYKRVVLALPGIEKKGRYKMAESIFKCDRKKACALLKNSG